MESTSESPDEDFGVRLQWPVDPVGEPFDAPSPSDADESAVEEDPLGFVADSAREAPLTPSLTQADAPSRPAPVVVEALASLQPGEASSAASALAAVAGRVDALAAATVTFRDLVAQRLSEERTRIDGLVRSLASDLRAERGSQAGALNELGEAMARAADVQRRLTEMVDDLSVRVDTLAAEVTSALQDATSELQTIRRRTTVRAKGGSSLGEADLRAIADAARAAVKEALADEAAPAPRTTSRRRATPAT
jgi:hypothetical protein